MGVDHVNTRNSAPIHMDTRTYVDDVDIGSFDQTNFTNRSLRDRKRVLFNHESSIN